MATRPTTLTDEQAQGLETILSELVREHEGLEELAGEHRSAISALDTARLRAVVEQTARSLSRIAELEDRRCALLGLPEPRLGKRVPGQPTVVELAPLIDEPRRERVLDLATRLRELVERVRDRHVAIAKASESLAVHMRGLMQQVAAELSGTSTYSPRGRVESGTPIATGLDVRS